MAFQNFVVSNKIHPFLKNNNHHTRFAIAFNFAYAILNLSQFDTVVSELRIVKEYCSVICYAYSVRNKKQRFCFQYLKSILNLDIFVGLGRVQEDPLHSLRPFGNQSVSVQ